MTTNDDLIAEARTLIRKLADALEVAVQQPNREVLVKVIAKELSDYSAVTLGAGWDAEALHHKTHLPFEDLDDDTAEAIADAILAALPIPATGEAEPVYELFPGTQDALDALTIRPDGFWTDSREGHFRATGCDGTVCSVMHPDSAAWVEVTP